MSAVEGDVTGSAFACPSYPIKSVQVFGTFGGATCRIQGSNVPTSPSWINLDSENNESLAFASQGLKQIQQNTYWVRPYISGGDTTTDIDVYLLCVTER